MTGHSGTSSKMDPKRVVKSSATPSRTTTDQTRKAIPLATKDANISPPRPSSKLAPITSSHTHRSTGSGRRSMPTATITVKARSIYDKKTKLPAIIKAETARESDFIKFAKHRTLLTSFMSGRAGGSGSGGGDEETTEDAEADFLNVLNIPAFGNFTRMWVDAYFGEVSNRSAACELLIDSGSSLTWVNKVVYKAAVEKNNTRYARPDGRSFKITYSAGDIKGELHKDTISFGDGSVFVEKQIFGIVDEVKSPAAKKWRTGDNDVKGIFGIGPRALNKGTILDMSGRVIPDKDMPTVLDNMKKQKRVSAKVIGVNFYLPNEGNRSTSDSSSVSSGSDAGTVNGMLHFGGPKEGKYNPSTMKTIPATQRGTSQHFYGIDLTLKYNGVTVMDNKPGIIDSGSSFIALPEEVLNAYITAVGLDSKGRSVITYDSVNKGYRIARKDFDKLKPLEFDFVRGDNAKFMLSPAAQVCPPALTRGWASDGRDVLFLNLRKLTKAHEGRQFILGIGWMMWYYIVLDSSSENKKIGIAEIDGQTNFRWASL